MKLLLIPENRTKLSLFILGFTSIITQVIFIREFLSVFNGNELITGMILANWMLITGFGSFLGKLMDKTISKISFINISHIGIAILPFITMFLVYYLKSRIYPVGKMVNLAEIFFNSCLLLAPFCIATGMLFPGLATIFSQQSKSNVINKAYSIEAIGSLMGGLLFNFLFVFILKPFYSLTFLLMINFIFVIINLYLAEKKVISFIISGCVVVVTVMISFSNVDHKVLKLIYPSQEIIYFKDTPYGKIVVTYTEGQYNFFENGNFLFSEDNVIESEESVHYAMVQHKNPRNVLLISGGISGMINEILKYKVSEIDYVEINPELINVGRLFTSNILQDPRLNVINQDARLFIKQKKEKKYDVVLINLPDPSSLQIDRYYTIEFFEELQNNLNGGAIIALNLSSASDYLGTEARRINSSVYLTLKLLFENVIIIRGGQNFYIASDGPLTYAIAEQIHLGRINNEYVNSNYLDDKKIKSESKLIEEIIHENVSVNSDFRPVVYLYQLQYWLSKFDINYYILIALILFPVFYSFLKLNFINYGVFITGFSASSIEVILILAFQIIYGYVYQMLGIIITFFMAGLIIGAYYMINKIKVSIKNYSLIQYLIGLFSIMVALTLYLLRISTIGIFIVHVLFVFLIVIIGILTGLQFAVATKLRVMNISGIAASTYAADLFGAAIGAVLIAGFLIPYFGIIKVALIIAIINFITGLYILSMLKKQ